MATGDALSKYSFAVALGKSEVETVKHADAFLEDSFNSGGLVARNQQGARKPGQMTITRGLDKSTAFTDWIKKTSAVGKADGQNLSVLVKEGKMVVKRLNLFRAWVSAYDGPSPGASSSAAEENVTVEYEEMSIE